MEDPGIQIQRVLYYGHSGIPMEGDSTIGDRDIPIQKDYYYWHPHIPTLRNLYYRGLWDPNTKDP